MSDAPDLASLAARWDRASGHLFGPLLMDPEQYQQVVLVLADLLERLRGETPSTAALLEVSERAPRLAAGSLERAAADGQAPVGVDPEVLAMTALAQRYRELVAAEQMQHRLAVLAQAREDRGGWTVLEESGDPDGDPYRPYRRLEADPISGRAVLVRSDPDEDHTGSEHHAVPARVDLRTGELTVLQDDGERSPLPDVAAREAQAAQLRAAPEVA